MAIPTFAVTPFRGVPNGSIEVTANGGSQTVRVMPDMRENANPELRQLRVANRSTTEDAWIAWGDSTITTTALTGMAIPANDIEVLTIGSASHIAFITGGGNAALNFTPGGGV